ncbi:hypothetical protein PBY51_013348 [Eleginops maclovinus]|uniref:Uncharacterized protein n=1 Tax=Eleginops maclovinus TaxID=56733 RepID=A0AAN8AWZ9_ELEMC|nr:hypothetical protein PBY51_013348 [Eleginops maclovinus]
MFDADRNKHQQHFPSPSSLFAFADAADAERFHIARGIRSTFFLLSIHVNYGSTQSPCGALGWQDVAPQSPASSWCARIMLQSAKLGTISSMSPSHFPPYFLSRVWLTEGDDPRLAQGVF